MKECETQTIIYQCECCKTFYYNKKEALCCENKYKEFNDIKDKLKSWMWYELEQRQNNKKELIFSYKAELVEDQCCKKTGFRVYDYSVNQYFESNYWKIINIYTPRELYIKDNILPNFDKEITYEKISHNMPLSVVIELSELIDDYKTQIINKLRSSSKEELIDKIVSMNMENSSLWQVNLLEKYNKKIN